MTLSTILLVILYFPPLASITFWLGDFFFFYGKLSSKKWMSPELKESIEAKKQKILPFAPFFARLKRVVLAFNFYCGVLEYYVRAPRNYIFGITFGLYLLFKIGSALLFGHLAQTVPQVGYPLFFFCLTLWSGHNEIVSSLKIAEFLRANPAMSPKSFFDAYYQQLGPIRMNLPHPKSLPVVSPEMVSFKKNVRSQQTIRHLVQGFWDTTHLAHISLRTLKYVGTDYAREIFDHMASLWGKRVLQLFCASFSIRDTHKLENLPGKIILVFNHKSQLDFVFTFFALSQLFRSHKRQYRPRFIVARDHFLENPLVYKVVGVGQLIETVDMVFVDRKKRGAGFKNLEDAARTLAKKEIEIAIFPQGTRAEGNIDRSGKRRDAGYYTTVSPHDRDSEFSHLKKGLPYLALDSLEELSKQGRNEPLHLVFVGVKGTASIFSKQSIKIQTEVDVEYIVSDPLTLSPQLLQGIKKPEGGIAKTEEEKNYLARVDEILRETDRHLVRAIGLHENLKNRYLLDLQGYFRYPKDRLDAIEASLDNIESSTNLVYQILDRIYACPLKTWNPNLATLAQVLLDASPMPKLLQMRESVTTTMLEAVSTKMHGKKVRKKDVRKEKTENM